MENFIVIKAFPGTPVGTILKWCDESEAFKMNDFNLLKYSEVVNNKEYFTIATNIIFVAIYDTHLHGDYYVINTYVGNDYEKAKTSLLDYPINVDTDYYKIETWVNGVKISEKSFN